MEGPDDREGELIDLASRRLDILDRLGEVALEKREMVDEFGLSRSTVNRAVAELEDAGLVTTTDQGHATTLSGRLAADMYRRVIGHARDVRAATGILAPLDATSPIGLELLSGADLDRIDGPPPYPSIERIRDGIRRADRVRAVVPTIATVETLRVCHARVLEGNLSAELLFAPGLFDRLASQFPGVFRDLARTGRYAALTGELPRFTTFLVEDGGAARVFVVVYTADNAIHGVIANDAPAAVRWAEDRYGGLRDAATDRTGELEALEAGPARPMYRGSGRDPSGTAADGAEGMARGTTEGERGRPADRERGRPADAARSGGPTERSGISGSAIAGAQDGRYAVELEANGFVRLSPEYFAQREPAPPATCWRTGLDLVEVLAGYAIDREVDRDGGRENLTDDLIERLRAGADLAVVGPPGSGKSTVCKSVACRWYEAGYGPVFYRESGYGRAFDAPVLLGEQLRRSDGHALVVVEDAVRAEANAVFGLMEEWSGDPDVTFLLDAREQEWRDPEEFPIDAGLEAYRHEVVETVVMPGLDETESRRLVRHFEETIEGTVEPPVDDLIERLGEDAEADVGAPRPGEILLLLHRLSAYADPLAKYGRRTPTSLTQDVGRTYDELAGADDDLALDVGLTVNLLNAAGVGVHPDLVHALAGAGQHGAVRDALARLEGQVVFPADRPSVGEAGPYRSIHESWSRLFLSHLLVAEPEREARKRFGRCVSALLSLADDPERRERIDWEFEGDAPYVNDVMIAPGEWADDFVRRVFALGQAYPAIAPLFGKSDYAYIELPAACSPETAIRCVEWRGEMHLKAGAHELAADEFERLADLAEASEALDPETAGRLVALSLTKRGEIEMHQGDLETAEDHVTRGLEAYRDLGDVRGEAASLLRLGIIEWTRGRYGPAADRIGRSLERYRDVEDRRGESRCLGNLAVIALRTGDLEDAAEYATRSLEVRRALGADLGVADSLLLLGEIALERDALSEAEEYLTRSLETARESGARRNEANSLLLLGKVAWERRGPGAAPEYLDRSLEIWEEIGVDHGRAECLRALGNAARERGDHGDAEDYLARSLDVVRAVGDRREEAETLVDLADLAVATGEHRLARERLESTVDLARDVGADGIALDALERLVEVCESLGDTAGAVTHCEAAIEVAREADRDDRRATFERAIERLSEEPV